MFKCASCLKQFNVKTGTIFENTKVPLRKWFLAIYFFSVHKSGISALQVGRYIGVSVKTAWFMHHKIMQAYKIDLTEKENQPGEYEVDEVYVGPLKHRMSKTRWYRIRQGTGVIHCIGILAFLNRSTGIFGTVIQQEKPTRYDIQPIMKRFIHPNSLLMTDGSGLYHQMDKYVYQHEQFIHANGEYARGYVHSNTIEGSFRHFKDSIRGSFKSLGRKYMQSYWDEFCFRYNNRNKTDTEKFELAMTSIDKKITYTQVQQATNTQLEN